MSIAWQLIELARIIASAKHGIGRWSGRFPDEPESLLGWIPEETPIEEYLDLLGEELIAACRVTDVVPKAIVGTSWWFFAELLALPESMQGRDRAVELAWIWRDKLDKAFGGVTITG